MHYAYQLPGMSKNFKELHACYAMNSTCSANMETIKPLVCDSTFLNIQQYKLISNSIYLAASQLQ